MQNMYCRNSTHDVIKASAIQPVLSDCYLLSCCCLLSNIIRWALSCLCKYSQQVTCSMVLIQLTMYSNIQCTSELVKSPCWLFTLRHWTDCNSQDILRCKLLTSSTNTLYSADRWQNGLATATQLAICYPLNPPLLSTLGYNNYQ